MDAIRLSARTARRRRAGAFVAIAVALVAAAGLARRDGVPSALADTAEPFANFEGPQVHPIAITPDGTRLLAVNTPNATLSIFDLTGGTPALRAEIPVGLEPVSVAARDDREAWVVNWLSDSVSVVDLATGNVTRTIDVGDEPADVVFAGAPRERAFVSIGGERRVKVFDPSDPAAAPTVVEVRGRQPRALARDASGARVFVSVFQSGNRTTIVRSGDVKALGGPPKPSPAMSPSLPKAPDVGLIVQQKGKKWVDETGKGHWKRTVPYTLADVDLVVLDASADAPKVAAEVHGVGTNVAGAAFDPEHDRLYVASSEAHNVVRFEPNVRGRFMDSRVSIVDLAAGEPTVRAADLNAHVDFTNPDGSDAERAESLALPGAVARAADGTLYVAAMGSAKVGVLDAEGAVVARIDVGAGPTGLVADDARGRLYVLDRVDGAVSVVDAAARRELSRVALGADPEPADVRAGRRIFYDTTRSAHGTVSCASCHLGGHLDGLAWDLGDPTGEMATVTGPPLIPILFPTTHVFHPMKGPMVTQSLRGLGGTEPFHWRGDRADLAAFNPAFMTLLGAPRVLSSSELASFEAFVRSLAYPPNPRENLDRTPPDPADGPSAARGRLVYLQQRTDRRVFTCNDCHTVSPQYGPGTDGLLIPGILLVGLDNASASQDLKVPQLRGLYEKASASFARGERVDGFGLTHDGGIDNIDTFLRTANFVFPDAGTRDDLAAFVLSLDTGTAPAVGAQVTLTGADSADRLARVETLAAQADAGNCDLVVTGLVGGERTAYVYAGAGSLVDAKRGTSIALADLVRAAAPGAEVTVTGVPVGRGRSLLAGTR